MSQNAAPAVLNNISSSILGPPAPVPKIFSSNSSSDKTFVIPRDNQINQSVSRHLGPSPTRFPSPASPDKGDAERQFPPFSPFPTSINNMTVDEIIDKWCTPTKSTNVQQESSTSCTTRADADSTNNGDTIPSTPEESVVTNNNKRTSDQIEETSESTEDENVIKKPRLE